MTENLAIRAPDGSMYAPVLRFSELEYLAQLYEKMGWTPDEEYAALVELARTAASDTVRLRAMKQLREVAREIMLASGALAKVQTKQRKSEGPEGSSILEESVVMTLMTKGGPVYERSTNLVRSQPPCENPGPDSRRPLPDPGQHPEEAGPHRDDPSPSALPGLCGQSRPLPSPLPVLPDDPDDGTPSSPDAPNLSIGDPGSPQGDV